jgi:hypothetical protein
LIQPKVAKRDIPSLKATKTLFEDTIAQSFVNIEGLPRIRDRGRSSKLGVRRPSRVRAGNVEVRSSQLRALLTHLGLSKIFSVGCLGFTVLGEPICNWGSVRLGLANRRMTTSRMTHGRGRSVSSSFSLDKFLHSVWMVNLHHPILLWLSTWLRHWRLRRRLGWMRRI